jgi:hypothetical protein
MIVFDKKLSIRTETITSRYDARNALLIPLGDRMSWFAINYWTSSYAHDSWRLAELMTGHNLDKSFLLPVGLRGTHRRSSEIEEWLLFSGMRLIFQKDSL